MAHLAGAGAPPDLAHVAHVVVRNGHWRPSCELAHLAHVGK